jgi:hypothetical protein
MRLSYTMDQTPKAAPDTARGLGPPSSDFSFYLSLALLLAAVLAAGAYAMQRWRRHLRDVQTIKTLLKQDHDLDVDTITYQLERAHPGTRYSHRQVAKLMKRLAAKGEVRGHFVDSVESYSPVRRAVYSLPD